MSVKRIQVSSRGRGEEYIALNDGELVVYYKVYCARGVAERGIRIIDLNPARLP